MASADEYFAIIDELITIFQADQRTVGIQEYVFGEKDHGQLKFPTMYILPEDDSDEGDPYSRTVSKLYLVILMQDLNVNQGKRNAVRLALDIKDILKGKPTLNGKAHDVKIGRVSHDTGKDNQGRTIHWEMLELSVTWKVFTGAAITDPWLEALASWTTTELGNGWTVYRSSYPENYNTPGILWRMSGITVKEKTNSGFEVRKTFQGQILGNLPYQEAFYGAVKIIEGLRRDIKIPLDVANKRYLLVADTGADIRPNILEPAQITVALARTTNRPTEEVPYLMEVSGSGTLS